MFPQFKKINNESGVVLFIVLMTAIIIMIFSVGILTQSINENNFAQQQIDQITCDKLKEGVFWNAQSSNSLGNSQYSLPPINGRIYIINTISTYNAATGGNTWQISCNYDTFS